MDEFARRLLSWYESHGRKDLPWQHPLTPYRVWISEVMLQQTQVNTVIPYYSRFIERFPDVRMLARAPLDEVLHLWSGLGYYARARNLHAAARMVSEHYGGAFPTDIDPLLKLPGVGRSTAGAILALALGRRYPILDGNVKRVLARYHAVEGWPDQVSVEQRLWKLAETHTPGVEIAQYTQAIMDLGATVCTRSRPRCKKCPLELDCRAHRSGREAEFPTTRPQKTLPIRYTTFVILQNPRGEILLEQRPPTGIWGGLWSFPECPLEIDPLQWCQDELGCSVQEARYGPTLQHTFSHFHLVITPLYAQVQKGALKVMESRSTVWYKDTDPTPLGLAAPVAKLIEGLKARPGSRSKPNDADDKVHKAWQGE